METKGVIRGLDKCMTTPSCSGEKLHSILLVPHHSTTGSEKAAETLFPVEASLKQPSGHERRTVDAGAATFCTN